MHLSRSTRMLVLCLSLVAATTFVACTAAAESALMNDQTSDSRDQAPPPGDGTDPRDLPGDPGDLPGGDPGDEPGGGDSGDGRKPDEPVANDPPVVGQPPDDPTGSDGALPVEPEPGIVNPIPHAWDRITVGPDGRTITIYYWGGVEDCYGLASVDATFDDDGVLHVTVLEGQRGNLAPNTACIEIALLKSVTITLDRPVVAPAQ